MRSKTEYIPCQNEQGRSEIRKAGLAPVQREGLDYEFGTVFDLSPNHMALVSKDRSGLFGDTPFKLSKIIGERLLKWGLMPQLVFAFAPEMSEALNDCAEMFEPEPFEATNDWWFDDVDPEILNLYDD